MQTEIEAKFTDIDTAAMRRKLNEVGAKLTHPERLMRRSNFDVVAGNKDWVRVRDEGDKVTLTYKRLVDRTLYGTKEINLTVDSFDRAVEFMQAIGLKGKAIQETKRETSLFQSVNDPQMRRVSL